MTQARARTLLRDRRYRTFWLGQVTSTLGNQLTIVVLPALVVPSRGPGMFGLLLAVESVVMGVLLLVGGVVADRYSRSVVMAISDVFRLVGVGGFLLFASRGPLLPLLLAAALTGAGAALYEPAHRAALAQVVEEDLRQQANAFDSATKRVGGLVGSLLAGLLLANISPPRTLLVDLATIAISLVTLVWLRLPRVQPAPEEEQEEQGLAAVFAEAKAGLAEVRRRPWVSAVMLQGTAQVFFLFGPNYVLVPMVSQQRYGIEAFGWVSAATFVGSVLGSMAGSKVTSKRPGLWAMNALTPCLLTPVCLMVDVPLWLFCAAMAVGSVGVGCFMVLWYTALQNEFPEEVQGRVFALEALASFGLQPIALATAPALVALMGITPFAVLAVIVLLISTYAVLIVPGTVRLASPPKPSSGPKPEPKPEPKAPGREPEEALEQERERETADRLDQRSGNVTS
ncbi:MFS transporter [Streptomyces castrisilvae]|uniref:MFS transporter n=1 Tax=Streptomyces castrisilvae TaxID=3033811 RepID=A0ABY9HN51_9ACTN|nr:MFS transporter [Streptomyces sp. Mut1]WLQ35487.1 MFS transporter [Streptomyces sp. Mut1]